MKTLAEKWAQKPASKWCYSVVLGSAPALSSCLVFPLVLSQLLWWWCWSQQQRCKAGQQLSLQPRLLKCSGSVPWWQTSEILNLTAYFSVAVARSIVSVQHLSLTSGDHPNSRMRRVDTELHGTFSLLCPWFLYAGFSYHWASVLAVIQSIRSNSYFSSTRLGKGCWHFLLIIIKTYWKGLTLGGTEWVGVLVHFRLW